MSLAANHLAANHKALFAVIPPCPGPPGILTIFW